MEDIAPDRKPGRVLTLCVPLALGVLCAASVEGYCSCKVTWTQQFIGKAAGSVAFFVFWWIAVMVCFYGYHFVRALFIHPN